MKQSNFNTGCDATNQLGRYHRYITSAPSRMENSPPSRPITIFFLPPNRGHMYFETRGDKYLPQSECEKHLYDNWFRVIPRRRWCLWKRWKLVFPPRAIPAECRGGKVHYTGCTQPMSSSYFIWASCRKQIFLSCR